MMKKIILRFPLLSRVLLALLLGSAALVLNGLLFNWIPVTRFSTYTAVLLLVLVTAIMYRTDGQSINKLGLRPNLRNSGWMLLGLVVGGCAFMLAAFLRTVYTGEQWHFTSYVDLGLLLNSLWWILPSVFVEELMFRGYLFTKAIDTWGITKANILFAILFMLVHVLDRDVMKNPVQMLVLGLIVPVGHLFFATGFLRTGTLLFAVGLHWGNNWATRHFQGITDDRVHLMYTTGHQRFDSWFAFIVLLSIFIGTFLLITLVIWKWKRKPSVN